MGYTINNLFLRGILEGIMDGIGEIYDTNDEVVCGSNGNNQPECGCCQDSRGGLVKVNAFYLESTISTMVWSVTVDIFTDLIDSWR